MSRPVTAERDGAPARLEVRKAAFDETMVELVVECAVGPATAVLRANSWAVWLCARETRLALLPHGVGHSVVETPFLDECHCDFGDIRTAWATDPDATVARAVVTVERALAQPEPVCCDGSSGEDIARLVGTVIALAGARPGHAVIETGVGDHATARASLSWLTGVPEPARELIWRLVEGANPVGWILAPDPDAEGESRPLRKQNRTIPIPAVDLSAHGRMEAWSRLREAAAGMTFRPGRSTAIEAFAEFERAHGGGR